MNEHFFANVQTLFIRPDNILRHAMEVIDRGATGIALVVDQEDRLLATVSDGDIRRALLRGRQLDDSIALHLAQDRGGAPAPVTARFGTTSDALRKQMAELGIQQIPLLDPGGKVVDLALAWLVAPEPELPLTALIMAGGLGSRLMPLTEDCPKPMLPVGGRPLLEFTLKRLGALGIRDVSVATHYLPEKIVEHFGDGSRLGLRLHYLNEERPLGTAGALSLLPDFAGPMLVMNGDVVTDLDFRAMLRFHSEHGAIATVAVARYEIPVPYGVVEHDGVQVTGIAEKPTLKPFINAGIYLIEPSVHAHIPKGMPLSMTDLIDRLVKAGERVILFPVREYWVDIGQHTDYQRVQQDAVDGVIRAWQELA